MWSLLKFTLITNTIAAFVILAARLLSNDVADMLIVDLMFITGVLFWLMSTVVRLGDKRFKKAKTSHEVTLTDPQIVLKSNNLATRFLAAGVPGILGAIIVGSIFY
jgi:hypothetical protein